MTEDKHTVIQLHGPALETAREISALNEEYRAEVEKAQEAHKQAMQAQRAVFREKMQTLWTRLMVDLDQPADAPEDRYSLDVRYLSATGAAFLTRCDHDEDGEEVDQASLGDMLQSLAARRH